ncbi:MAG: 4Fe-4S binding protein [Thermodesulfobacteria bacterium]|nr:4Fe-4S binding protein [Thermodesulfobacteriota bacterium]
MSGKKRRYSRWRLAVQTAAFLVILINPFLNYYWQFSFVQGWYQSLGIGKLWFVSPLEGLESILVSKTVYLPLLIGMLIPVLLALFLGRVFCGWICPIHFLSELEDRLLRLLRIKRRDLWRLPRMVFWFALIGELLLSMIIGAPLFVFLSPPGLVGREIMMAVFFHTLALEGVIVVLVLTLNLFTRRFFCRYLCPLGALLAFLGSKRRLLVVKREEECLKCGLCDRACPLGLSPSQGEGASLYCWNCGECVDACRLNALAFRWRAIGPRVQSDSQPRDE